MVSWQGVGLVIDTLNSGSYKYAFALLMLEMNNQERKNDQRAQIEHQRQMELLQQQGKNLQDAQALKMQGTQQSLQLEGQIESQLQDQLNKGKYESQSALAEQRNNNKIQEAQVKSDLKKQEKQPSPLEM